MRNLLSRYFYQLALTPLVLVLLFALACGGTAPAEPVVVEKEVIREVEKPVVVEKEVIKEVEKSVIVEKEVVKEVEVIKEVVKEVLVEPTVAPVAVGAKPWTEWVKRGKYGGDLNMGMAYETDHWDIHQSCCNRSLYIPRDLYNMLVMYNPEDQTTIIGDLADSWEWAEDGNSVTFRLPANAQWSDGTPVTADDIVFSLDRMSDLTKIRPRVRNIAPYYKDSVAPDPQTVQVNTKFSNPAALLPFLATGYMVMLPKHVLDGRADAEEFFDTPENIVGSGAFTFVNHERGSSMKIEKNPNYFKEGLPFLDSVTAYIIADKNTHMSAFITGQIDFSPGMGLNETDADNFIGKIEDKGKLFYNGPNLMRFYEINFNNPPVDDPRVRRALYIALDREEINRVRRLGRAKLGVPFFADTQWSSSDEEVATWPGYRYVDAGGDPITGAPYGIEGDSEGPAGYRNGQGVDGRGRSHRRSGNRVPHLRPVEGSTGVAEGPVRQDRRGPEDKNHRYNHWVQRRAGRGLCAPAGTGPRAEHSGPRRPVLGRVHARRPAATPSSTLTRVSSRFSKSRSPRLTWKSG